MKNRRILYGASALMVAFAASGCTHRLLPNQGDSAVRVYQDEDVYKGIQEDLDHIRDPKFDPGTKKYLGMILGLAGTESRDVDGGTRVKIISSNADGYVVEVEEGKYLGYQGFVPKANLR